MTEPRITFWKNGYPFWIHFVAENGAQFGFTLERAKILKVELEVAIEFIQREEEKLHQMELVRIAEKK